MPTKINCNAKISMLNNSNKLYVDKLHNITIIFMINCFILIKLMWLSFSKAFHNALFQKDNKTLSGINGVPQRFLWLSLLAHFLVLSVFLLFCCVVVIVCMFFCFLSFPSSFLHVYYLLFYIISYIYSKLFKTKF